MITNDDFFNRILQSNLCLQQVATRKYRYNNRQLVYQHDKVKLYHYAPKTSNPQQIPVLVVFATVNRPEILDLFPEHSFIGGLLDEGLDVYLLDWGYPDAQDANITLGDYVCHYLQGCVQFICEKYKLPQIDLVGICQGGLICLCYSALFLKVHRLVLISAPIDFQTDENKIAKILQHIDVENILNQDGNVSGSWLTGFFIALRPFELVGLKYLGLVQHIHEENWVDRFLQVEKWLHDAPDQAGAAFTQLIIDCYQQNKLIKGELILAGQRVNLQNVTVPILNIIAAEDEIVPPSASTKLQEYVGSKVLTQQTFPSGHIGIYVSEKVGKTMSGFIGEWLKNI